MRSRWVIENAPKGWKDGVRWRGKGKTRRGLESNIIRKRKTKAIIMLDDKVLKAEYHEEELDNMII